MRNDFGRKILVDDDLTSSCRPASGGDADTQGRRVMRGGFDYNEVSRALYSLGFQIDTYMPPEKVQKEYFEGRADGLKAFENVSLISASYTAGYDYE